MKPSLFAINFFASKGFELKDDGLIYSNSGKVIGEYVSESFIEGKFEVNYKLHTTINYVKIEGTVKI